MSNRKRKNGEGTWGTKVINGYNYKFYRTAQGKYVYGKTEKEIKEKLKKMEKDAFLLNGKTTFGEYLSNWLKLKKSSLEESTYSCYETMISAEVLNFKGYDLANKQLKNLSGDVFQAYLDAMAEKYSRATIEKMWAIIKECVKYGEVKGELPVHTTTLVKLPIEASVAVKKKEVPFLSKEDAELFYQAASLCYANGEPIFGANAKAAVFIMYSGLRISEMIALKWKNVDMKDKKIRIVESMGEKKNDSGNEEENRYVRYDKAPKNENSGRTIPLPDRAMEMLEWFFQKHPQHKESDYVFLNKQKQPLNRRNMNKTIKAMAIRGGLKEQNFAAHSLRHTYGYLLLKEDVNIKIISKLLGHKEISTTYDIYIDVLEEDNKNAVEEAFNKKEEE